MAKIVDLEQLFPEEEKITLKDKAGTKYTITVFLPAAVGFLILDNIETVQSMFPGTSTIPKPTKEGLDLMIRIVSLVCHEQHEEIDETWIKKNVSLPKLVYILYKLSLPVYEFIVQSGFLEAVRPVKTPEATQADS